LKSGEAIDPVLQKSGFYKIDVWKIDCGGRKPHIYNQPMRIR